jgi:hypothetical protein
VRCAPQVLGQSRNGQAVAGFVLNAVDTTQAAGAANLTGEPGNAIEPDSRLCVTFVGHGDFDAVRITRERHGQVRMTAGKMREHVLAGGDNGFLEFGGFFGRQARGLREVARGASGSGRQPGVGINLQFEGFGFSAHCSYSRELHRKLPGNPGNSTGRPRKASR